MTEADRAMHLAIDQLRSLRTENAILRAKVETLDLLAMFLFARTPEASGHGMSEDAVWLLQKVLDKREEGK